MSFARHQTRGGIQSDPACTGQIHLAPGVQIGEVNGGATGAVQRFHIGGELDQITRHKACCQAAMAQQLNQQPGRVTAGTARQTEGFFRRLHTRLHADQVLDVLLHQMVQADQKVDGALVCAVDFL